MLVSYHKTFFLIPIFNMEGTSMTNSFATDYQGCYDAETRDLTARLYAEDIERFGYTF